jgi:hypothetical protein
MDNATHGREWTTTASDKSGRGTTGRRRSSKINDHTVLNLSPFTVIFDNTERTQRQPRCGEGVLRTGTHTDRSWAALAAMFPCCVAATLSLFLFVFYFFGRAHDMGTRLIFCLINNRHMIYTYNGTPVTRELAYFFC